MATSGPWAHGPADAPSRKPRSRLRWHEKLPSQGMDCGSETGLGPQACVDQKGGQRWCNSPYTMQVASRTPRGRPNRLNLMAAAGSCRWLCDVVCLAKGSLDVMRSGETSETAAAKLAQLQALLQQCQRCLRPLSKFILFLLLLQAFGSAAYPWAECSG